VLDEAYEKAKTLALGELAYNSELSDFRGKVVYIDFWSTYCGPCSYSIEHHGKEMQEIVKDKDVVLLYVALKNDVNRPKEFMEEQGITGVQLIAGGKDEALIREKYYFNGIPHYTLLFFLLIKYIKTERAKWLYGASVAFAFGFLNKYNIGFLVAGLLPAMLISKHRKIFMRKELYAAIIIALVIVSPNLIWQWFNHFPVVKHLNELSANQLVNVQRVDFLSTQFLFYSGSLAVILASLYALLFYKPFKDYRFLLTSFIFILAIFTYLKAKDYYAIGLYPVYIALGAVFLADVMNKKWGKAILICLMMFPFFSFIYMYGFLFPNKTPEYIINHPKKYEDMGMLRWEDGKHYDLPQDFADMLGWRELAEITDKAYSDVRQTGETLVLCDNYGQAGVVNFYSEQGVKAVSFSADYIDWFDLDRTYVNLIRVINGFERETEFRETVPYFQEAYTVIQ